MGAKISKFQKRLKKTKAKPSAVSNPSSSMQTREEPIKEAQRNTPSQRNDIQAAMLSKNYYGILGVTRECSQAGIHVAYQRSSHKYRGVADAETLKAIEEAYKVLSDPRQRFKYDESRSNSEGVRVWRPGEYGHPALRQTSSAFQRKFGDGMDLESVHAQLEKRNRERIIWD